MTEKTKEGWQAMWDRRRARLKKDAEGVFEDALTEARRRQNGKQKSERVKRWEWFIQERDKGFPGFRNLDIESAVVEAREILSGVR